MILIADDDPSVVASLGLLLKRHGHATVGALSQEEALRHLEKEGEAAGERADPTLLEELLLGQAGLHRVALVAPLDLLDLGLQELHPALRGQLAPIERDHDGPDDQGEDDDRPADRRREAESREQIVEGDQDDEHRLEDRGEDPGQEADRVGARLGRRQRQMRRR